MADVTTSFAAKDESFAQTVDRLNARLAGFQSTVADFSGKVGNMASAFGGFASKIGVVAAAFFGAQSAGQAFIQAISVGGQLAELSARTGETAGNLAVLQRAFENAGSSGEAVGPMLNRLQKFMVEASTGGKQQIETMTGLGLTYEQLAGKTPTEQMALFASRISEINDPAQRATAAIAIFGKSGGELLPLLQNMGSELATARNQLGGYPEAVDQAAASLDGIGDAFAAVKDKAQEFITGALVKIAPELENVLNAVAQIDFASFGMKLSEYLQKAFDFFRGLWSDPSQIFGLLADYLDATFRQAGDSLVTAFLTASNALKTFFSELASSGAFGQLGQLLADALMFGASKLGTALLDGIIRAMDFFGNLWNSVTGQGVSGLASKLFDTLKAFANGFIEAMSNPVEFITGKLDSLFSNVISDNAKAYEFAFDSATGSYIEKARAGLKGVSDTAGARLEQSADNFGKTIVTAATSAASKTELVKSNLFGGAEAVDQVNKRVGEIVKAGKEYRGEIESSTKPAQQVKEEAQETASEGRSFAGAINSAKIDAKASADVFTGLSDRMKTAVNNTSGMLDKMREAFHLGRKSSEEVYQKYRDGGMSILEASKAASQYMAGQNKADSDLRRLENKNLIAENTRDRAYARADRYEQRGQQKAAHELRMRADARFTKSLEEISPELKKGAEVAGTTLGDGASGAGKDVSSGGSDAEDSMTSGGKAAGESISTAASALKEAVSGMGKALALEATLKQCQNFLKSIDKKLPQNALS